ncbi:lipopolysaccharide biosynthesis protein [Enterococcus sp. CSURQ0835]|uniref:lipopolysaccharide biosynthesis protein n=1 Tax=Enterococcus sp. CSURQ0835 TaxID=2681394 RepID=UPI00135AAFF2|nr:lipopolysaccharide biosynthesis protein [Enterococcus sp. CSURQ0835]
MKKILASQFSKPTDLKKSSLWYSTGTFTYAASSVYLLLVVTRVLGPSQAGIFSIGWAVCQQMYAVGLYGTRNFQVADIESRYSDKSYFQVKLFTIVMMLLGSIVYSAILGVSQIKLVVSLLLTFLMCGETIADVLAGFLQKRERLDLSGKSYFFRIVSYDLLFTIILFLTGDMRLAIGSAAILSIGWLLLVDYQWVQMIGYSKQSVPLKRVIQLLKECTPIFLSAFLTNYIVNIPKNSIELFLADKIQSIYNILFMPSAIITLFMSFVLVPMYTKISTHWLQKEYTAFKKIVLKIVGIIVGLTIIAIVGGYLVGIPVLGIIYNVNLNPYKLQFILLILGGGINSLATFLVYVLTVFGRQRLLIYVYTVAALIATLISNHLVSIYAISGAALVYLLAILFISLLLLTIVIRLYFVLTKQSLAK